MARIILALVVISSLVLGSFGCSAGGQAGSQQGGNQQGNGQQSASKEDITIGIITSMSGPAADFGVSAREGAEQAVTELNAAGGVLGRNLKLIYRDDESNPQKGVSAAQELVNSKSVQVIMGGNSTPVSMAASPIINDAKMIFMTMGTGTPAVDLEKFPYNFRIIYYSGLEAKVLVDYALKTKGYKKIGILTDSSAYGKSGQADLLKNLDAAGVKPVGMEQYNWGDTDMTGQLLKLRQAGAEALLMWGMGPDIAQVAKSAQKMGWTVPAIAGSGINQLTFGKLAGEAGKDWVGTLPKRVSYTDKDPLSKDVSNFIDTLEKKYGKDRGTYVPNALIWADMVKLYADAVKRAGSTDTEKVKTALEATKDFKGMISTYSFSPTKHDGFRIEDLSIVYAASVERGAIWKRAPDAP